MKSTCILAAAAAALALSACKKSEETTAPAAPTTTTTTTPATSSNDTASGTAAPVAPTPAPAPVTPPAATASAADYEKQLLTVFNESVDLLTKFAEGGTKEEYIAGMKALGEKNSELKKASATPELQAQMEEFVKSPKFAEATQSVSLKMQEVITKHPEFAQKLMDPEIQAAMQELAK